MKRPLTALSALAAAAAFAHATSAQPPAPPPAEAPPAPDVQAPVDVSADELDTFTEIYVELQETAQEYEARMSNAESQEDAQQLQMQMRQESIETIESYGWSPDQYNRVAEAINSDPDLIEQAIALIEEKS